MPKFTVRTAEQLPPLLQAFRKEAGLTQSEVALRLGVSQQTYSAMERNADKVGTARLLKLLNILGVELALGTPAPKPTPKTDMAIACPTQVIPEMPRKALQDGTTGVVRAKVVIRDGVVKEVTSLSGPRVFHAAVRTALSQYKCTAEPGEVEATQEFNFTLN